MTLLSSMSIAFAGFIGDVPIMPVRLGNKSDLLEEDDPLYRTIMKGAFLIGQRDENGAWIWMESYGDIIIKPGGLIGKHPLLDHPLYDEKLPVLFNFHAELIDPENNVKGTAYSYEDGVDPDLNPPRPIEISLDGSKDILLYGFASPATPIGDGSVSIIPEEEVLASVDVNPDTLNLKSNGEWVTAYIELPEGYELNMIISVVLRVPTGEDTYTLVKMEESPSTVGDYDGDGIGDLMIKFDRSMVIAALGAEDVVDGSQGNDDEVTLTISGVVSNTVFAGQDIIRVKKLGK